MKLEEQTLTEILCLSYVQGVRDCMNRMLDHVANVEDLTDLGEKYVNDIVKNLKENT